MKASLNLKEGLTLLASLACAVPVGANAQVNSPFANAHALPEHALADIRGGQAWSLTRGNLQRLAKADEVQSSQWTALNARVQMDVWWGSAGSQLIANSVRAVIPN